MQRERDWLNSRVFPRIREELAKRHHHLEPIDLRLGVETAEADTEEGRELLVLKVCLDEIKRSRPFLLVLLGDRYGWVPPEERIVTAAREQGFDISPAGKSVTALEIEFGILKDYPEQKHRCLFFVRQPLPYDRMPETVRADYSDAHSPDPLVREGHAKLEALKDQLRRDPELASQIHEYTASWDEQANQVTDLEAFGDLVYDKLWAAIDEETKDWASQPAPTWEEQERVALAEFVEHRSRGFVGREDIIGRLLHIARSPVSGGKIEPSDRGACVTGSPGSGKSALFAKLHRDLDHDPSILLLANAAGGTMRGLSIDSMLRRWISELNTFLGVDAPKAPASATGTETEPPASVAGPAPNEVTYRKRPQFVVNFPAAPMSRPQSDSTLKTNEDVERELYSLLHRASSRQRVVILLDALDQTESTPRGIHLTWFRQAGWPANARIIATTIPCPASTVLAKAGDIAKINLPPLTAADAKAISGHVWGQYHRTLNPAVLAVLVDKKFRDGTPSCGNPLWLTLALEQLNLLDADDFIRAEHQFTGSPTERMTALLMEIAHRIPPDIEGLYGWLMEQNEETFGEAHTRAFATAIALSRNGWREADLLDLVPRLAPHFRDQQSTLGNGSSQAAAKENHQLDLLELAVLRRSFRAHIVRRGEHDLLDFFHAQMRRAVLARCAPDERALRSFHAASTDYLETLPPNDPLIPQERMAQLIGERDALRAARYYSCLEVDEPSRSSATEHLGATWLLVEWIAQGEARDPESPNPNLRWVTSWLEEAELSQDEVYKMAHNFQFVLLKAMENDTILASRLQLAESIRNTFARLTDADPGKAESQSSLAVSLYNIGDLIRAQGDLPGALKAFQDSLAIARRLSDADPGNTHLQYILSASQDKIGDVFRDQGDLKGALKALRDSLDVRKHLSDPDAGHAACQRDLSVSFTNIGDVLRAQGDMPGALDAFRNAHSVLQRIVDADPDNAVCRRELSVSFRRISTLLRAQGALTSVLKNFKDSLVNFKRLVESDPGDAVCQRDFLESFINIGNVFRDQGNLSGALKAFRDALPIAQHLADVDPSDTGRQHDVYVSISNIGDVLRGQDDLPDAFRAFRDALTIAHRLEEAEPDNARWKREVVVSYGSVATIAEQQAKGDAQEWWRKAYQKLSAMKQDGLMASTDEQFLAALRHKAEAETHSTEAEPPVQPKASSQFSDPTAKAIGMLIAGRTQDALDVLRTFIFPSEGIMMDHSTPLEARLTFVHALWRAGNVEGVLQHLPCLPEQDDSRVKELHQIATNWQRSLTLAQKLRIRKKPSLPPPPALC